MKKLTNSNSVIWSLILMVSLVGIFLYFYQDSFFNRKTTVAFLDVGQGDSIFIEAPNGVQVLVDAGSNASVVRELGGVMDFWDRKIDIAMSTHADKDHIGGFPEIFKRFNVETIYKSQTRSETAIYEEFMKESEFEGAKVVEAWVEDTIVLDEKAGVYLRVLFPNQDVSGFPKNEGSTIVQLVHGDIEVMLTGDANVDIEGLLVLNYGDFLESEILKAGHHGSKSSTSELFIKAVDPEYVVVSAGVDNRYGHPHESVVETILNSGAEMLETSKEGSIVFEIDGRGVLLK